MSDETHPGFPSRESDRTQVPVAVAPGTRLLGRYVFEKILGYGGFGVVWLVRDEQLAMPVAIKLISESIRHDPEAVEELKRETRISLRLTHPNIVRIYNFIDSQEMAGISMEYVDGGTLLQLKAQRPSKCFEVNDLVPWMVKLCEALDYAHGRIRVVHRDLKPGNLMLDSSGELKIADFGISRSITDSMTRLTSLRPTSGTPAYMSPQQMMGKPSQVSDDIYSMGAALFALLTGKPPFHTGDIHEQVRISTPPSIAARRRELEVDGAPVPAHWESTIAACLAKEPEARPPTALHVAQMLQLRGVSPIAIAPENALTMGPATTVPQVPESSPEHRGPGKTSPEGEARADPSRHAPIENGMARSARDRRQTQPLRFVLIGAVLVVGIGALLVARTLRNRPGSVLPAPVTPAPASEMETLRASIPRAIEEESWDRAASLIGELLRLAPGDPQASAWQHQVEVARGAQQRRSEVERLRNAIPAAMAAHDWARAEADLAALLQLEPGDSQALQWRERITAERSAESGREKEREATQKRASEITELARLRSKVQSDIEAGDWEAAARDNEQLLRHAPGDAVGLGARDRIARARAELGRKDRIAELRQSIPRSIEAADWTRAQADIAQLRQLAPDDAQAEQWSQEIARRRGRESETSTGGVTQRATPAASDEDAIAAIVSEYEKALESLNAERYFALWASVSDGDRTKIRRAFDDLVSQSLDVHVDGIEIEGSQAVVRFHEKRLYETKAGSVPPSDLTRVMTLRRSPNGAWQIVRLQ